MDIPSFLLLWVVTFAVMLALGVLMARVIAQHPQAVGDDATIIITPDDDEVVCSFKPMFVPENYIPEDDIDAYLDEQVAAHGGRVEITDFGYRHIWADGTRKVYWQEN